MSKLIVVTDRRTAYAELVARSSSDKPGCLLRIRGSTGADLSWPNGLVQFDKSTALADYVPISSDVDDVWGNPTWRGVELLYSLVVGYGFKMVVIDRIEWLLRDPDAVLMLRKMLPKIYEGASSCRCPVWIVDPTGCAEADLFMAGLGLSQLS